MSVQTGRRAMPRHAFYTGRARTSEAKRLRGRSSRLARGEARTGIIRQRTGTIRLIACAAVLLILFGIKTFFPNTADYVSKQLTSGIDYKAAFSALGRAITSGENITEVFKGITLGGFRKDVTESPSPSASPSSGDAESPSSASNGSDKEGEAVEAIGAVSMLDELEMSGSGDADVETDFESGGGSTGAEVTDNADDASTLTQNDAFLEELLLRLPEEELEEIPSETTEPPENVSYDYYVIEFDYVTPLKGSMTSTFGYRIHPISGKNSFHYGVDIGGSNGDAIAAFSSGTVELTGYNSVYGNYLFLRHKDGILSFYGHCSKILVEEGQLVRMGDTVAKVGSTGYSTGPHLHFEIRNGATIIDPLYYISPEG